MNNKYINIAPHFSILKSQIIGVKLEFPDQEKAGKPMYYIKIITAREDFIFRAIEDLYEARQVFVCLRMEIEDSPYLKENT